MNKLSAFLNYFISAVAFSFLVFGWGFFLTDSMAVSGVITALFFAMFSLLFFFLKNKRDDKLKMNKSLKDKRDKVIIKLLVSPVDDNLSLFCRLLSLPEKSIDREKNEIVEDNHAHVLCFYSNSLSLEKFFEVMRNNQNFSKITIYCLSLDKDISKIANSFIEQNISFVTCDEFFKIMVDRNVFPEISEISAPARVKFSIFIKESLKRQKSLGYALLGIFLVAFSLISPYKLYYQIFASLLIIFAIVVFFLKFEVNK